MEFFTIWLFVLLLFGYLCVKIFPDSSIDSAPLSWIPMLSLILGRTLNFLEILFLDSYIRKRWKESLSLFFDKNFCSCFCIATIPIIYYNLLNIEENYSLESVIFTSSSSIVIALIVKIFSWYNDEKNEYLKDYQSVGGFWASAAFNSYYSVISKDLVKRMEKFEKEHNIKFPVKKLIIVLPLSCDVRNTLDEETEGTITTNSELDVLEHDQGANINRKYKNTVYKIKENHEEFHIVAEYPSSLNTLWELKEAGICEKDGIKWQYERDCFAKILSDLVKSYPIVILKYDDLSIPHQPLSAFLKKQLLKDGLLNPKRD